MRGGHVRTYCQGSLGLGQSAFIIPAPPKCVTEPAMRLRIGAVERDSPTRVCLSRTHCFGEIAALEVSRAAQNHSETLVAPRKVRVEIDGPLKEFLRERMLLGAPSAHMPQTALVGRPCVEAVGRLAQGALLLGVRNSRGDRRCQPSSGGSPPQDSTTTNVGRQIHGETTVGMPVIRIGIESGSGFVFPGGSSISASPTRGKTAKRSAGGTVGIRAPMKSMAATTAR